MCGRFYIDGEMAREIEKIAAKIDRKNVKTGDVHPSEPALFLRAEHDSMVAEVLKWGYESARKNTLIFNARSETVREKPMFRYDYETHRCLIPACKFYEWKRTGENKKEKYEFLRRERFCIWRGSIIRSRRAIASPSSLARRRGV